MIWGMIIGAVIGVTYYVLRAGGVVFVRSLQSGLHVAIIQGVLHAIMPAAIGALIGWAVS